MVMKKQFPGAARLAGSSVPIGRLANDVLAEYEELLRARSISVDRDLESEEPAEGTPLLRVAISALIEQAIDAMPNGGELSLTLVSGPFQWELEIADTGQALEGETKEQAEFEAAFEAEPREILQMVPYRRQRCLDLAQRQARELGLLIESWKCPQGGTAWVLVCPVTQPQRKVG